MHLNTDMSNTVFTIITIAAILSPSVIANAFAEPSGGDSGKGSGGSTGDGGSSNDKPKTVTHMSGHKKGDGDRLAVPGVPVVRADNKHKQKDSNGGGLIVPEYQ
jgi:hypothetical protein